MSRKTTAALVAALGINFLLAGGAMLVANLNKPASFDSDLALAGPAGEIHHVAGREVQHDAGQIAVPLQAAQHGGNTRVTFTCGKATPAGHEEHQGTWDQIAGAVLYDPDGQQLIAVEATFDVRSLRTDTQALTNTVTVGEKWFDYENHPFATFTCDSVRPTDAAASPYTHELVGTFTLNGISKELTISAAIDFTGQTLTLDTGFEILRSDFDVEKRQTSLAGAAGSVVSDVDDAVQMAVRITASPDPSAVISELAAEIERHSRRFDQLVAELEQTRGSISYFAQQTRELEARVQEMSYAGVREVDTTDLPPRFTDAISDGTGSMVGFELVLVPGDTDAAIDPFYMSCHEVSWAMLSDWIYAELDVGEATRQIDAGARPSPLWGTLAQQFQVSDKTHPAMGMTRLTAEAYCRWLSERTGRRYRLPTHDEWMHALELGGGIPEDLGPYAWHLNNSPRHDSNRQPLTTPVGGKLPNKLGIHDMLGSLAEWVTETGDENYVVGGSMANTPQEITESWRAVENVSVWSASYPNLPYSRFWYVDYYFTGIRLACDPASVAANPPNGE